MTNMMKAIIAEDGQPLKVAEVERPAIGDNEVLVKVAAAGLNRADLVQRAGKYPPPPGASPIMGLECSGTVETVGAKVTKWKPGDKVCALLAGGGYAEYAAIDEGSLLPVPENLSLLEAAALPEAMMTVYANIFMRCAFREGESILIHGGTSGIGSMAIQMVKAAGAKDIWTTAGTAEKCEAATGFGATRAINYKTEDFEAVVRDGGGADVTLDMVGGDYVQKNISAARVNGRICNIAYLNGPVVELNLMPLMLKRLVLTGTTLRARPVAEKSDIRAAIEEKFWPLVASGAIRPVIDEVYPFAQADAAQAAMAKGGHTGKILLDLS
ncbi:NAD(P)H-quinone oxidoreductase [Henriciella pelagia]|uniref:NAD(P)H quinone oxidoreductase n=1 Tax=Henriciella pelagia TaxID=1977912 RepID=A0ABQ1JMW4_9PROT|nr:NAD(P)H-quinone oxidoreductase [Henriciella pelagia]GGB73085.1 NAD(P)H quinone oxidoreductase [Henriciella pelagia]